MITLIIEGADNLGKTTAAKRLAALHLDRTGEAIPVIHHGPPTDPVMEYSTELLRPAIHDRGHLGWLVWQGMLAQSGTEFDRLAMEQLVRVLRVVHRVIVVCLYADDDWYCERIAEYDDRDELMPPNIRRVANRAFAQLCWSRDGNCEKYVDIPYNVSVSGFPSDATLNRWLDRCSLRQSEAL